MSETENEIKSSIEKMREEIIDEADILDEVPKIGKFYVFRIKLKGGQIRYLISPLNFSSTFSFRKRGVMTEYGDTEGLSATMQLKLVGLANDVETEQIVGVYQILASDNFVKTKVKTQELKDSLTQDEIYKELVAIEYNTARRLKEILKVKQQENETLQKTLKDIKIDVPQAASEMAEGIISFNDLLMKGMAEGLDKMSGNGVINYIKDNLTTVLIFMGLAFLAMWAIVPALLR